jgi:hypothetical protein
MFNFKYNLSKLIFKNKFNMKKTLELTLEQAKALYPTAAKEFKEMLEINFGKNAFITDITERIKDFRDVLDYHGISKCAFENRIFGLSYKMAAYMKIELIESCLNEGKIPKLGEKRWYPYFNISLLGLGFGSSVCDFGGSSGAVAYFSSEKLSDHSGKHFTKEYEEFLK